MSSRRLISLSRRSLSTSASCLQPYKSIAEHLEYQINQLREADNRFLRYGSPHPEVRDLSALLSFPETCVSTLDTGLRVATESNLALHTATVGVCLDAGSRFETEETSGVAHFLEHMIVKGTGQRTVKALEEEIDSMGGYLSASTSRERTTFYANLITYGRRIPFAELFARIDAVDANSF